MENMNKFINDERAKEKRKSTNSNEFPRLCPHLSKNETESKKNSTLMNSSSSIVPFPMANVIIDIIITIIIIIIVVSKDTNKTSTVNLIDMNQTSAFFVHE